MTIEQQATELVAKFYPHVRWKMGQEDYKERAKECALICCDEIINLDYFSIEGREFWLLVKDFIQTKM